MTLATATTAARKRNGRPRPAWAGGAPHPFRHFAGLNLQFTGCMEGRLWFLDNGAAGFRVTSTGPVRYSKGVAEPLSHAEQEAILAAEQAGLCRLEPMRDHHEGTKSRQGPRSNDLVNLRVPGSEASC